MSYKSYAEECLIAFFAMHDEYQAIIQQPDYVDTTNTLSSAANFMKAVDYLEKNLKYDQSLKEITTIAYDAGKSTFGQDYLRAYFRYMNLVLFHKPDGPRLPVFIELYGVEPFKKLLNDKLLLENLFEVTGYDY